jgi:anti-sigma factor RsiW
LRVEHVTANLAIRYVSGEMSPAERAALEAHVAGCSACRERVEAQRRLAEVLGAWETPARGVDLTAAVLDRLEANPKGRVRRLSLFGALRIAAAVVLGVGLGHAGARLVPAPDSAQMEPTDAPAPSYALLSEPDVVGLWVTYDDLAEQDGEGAT